MPRRQRRIGEETSEQWELRRRGRKPKANCELTDELLNLHPRPEGEITLHDREPGFSARIRCNGLTTLHYRLAGPKASRRIKLGKFPELPVGEARAKIARIQAYCKSDGGEPISAFDPFSQAAARFLWHGEAKWSPSYLERSRRTFTNRFIPALGDTPIHKLDEDQIRSIIVHKDRSQETIKNDLALMSSFLSWCLRVGALSANKLRGSYRPVPVMKEYASNQRLSSLSLGELREFFNAATQYPNPMVSTIFLLIALTGFRDFQLWQISPQDIETDMGKVRFPAARSEAADMPPVTLGVNALDLLLRLFALKGDPAVEKPNEMGRPKRLKVPLELRNALGGYELSSDAIARSVERHIVAGRLNLSEWETHLLFPPKEELSERDEVVL